MGPLGFYPELLIAFRYLRGQGRTVIFYPGVRLSFLFLTILVFVMVVVLSVFEGFQGEVRKSLWNSGYHITLTRADKNRSPITKPEELEKQIRALFPSSRKLFQSVFPAVSVNALLEYRNRFEGKLVRGLPLTREEAELGVLKNYPRIVHFDRSRMKAYPGGDAILVGREMARYYGWQIGERLTLILPRGGILRRIRPGDEDQIRRRSFVIAGFFRTGYYEFDMNLMFLSLETARRRLSLPNRATEMVLQLNDLNKLEEVASALKKRFRKKDASGRPEYSVTTIRDKRKNYLSALQLERVFMVIIMVLLMMAGVAGIGVMVHQLVKSKSVSIGMLRSMGMSLRSVQFIFTANSMLIGLFATAAGGSFGIFFARRLESIIQLTEDFLNASCRFFKSGSCATIELIPRKIYYFDHLPVHINMSMIFGIALATLILSGLAGYFPARRAAGMDPARTIRND